MKNIKNINGTKNIIIFFINHKSMDSTQIPETTYATFAELESFKNDMDTMWLMFGGIFVFFMQTGFAMLEVGSVSIKNTKNILIKNISDAAIGAICWWLVGFGLAFGETSGRFLGTSGYALKGEYFEAEDGTLTNGKEYAFWLFQWAFAATASTIVSGAVAERVSFYAYVVYSVVLTSFIYPIVVHWVWGEGWASAFSEDRLLDCGVIDFAGSGVVHMTGGIAALFAAIIVGPRIGKFSDDGVVNILPEQSTVLQTLGTLIIWFGWYCFNGVSTLAIVGLSGVASKTMVNTTISAASCCIATIILSLFKFGYWDTVSANNGVLAGLVSVTAGCSTCEPEGAFVIGIIGAFIYTYSSQLLLKFKIDDVVNAIPVHGFCGAWGIIAASLFTTKDNYAHSYGNTDKCAGILYGGDGSALISNLVFLIAVITWTSITSFLLFFTIKKTIGIRVEREIEEKGMDESKHGGMTYPEMRSPVNNR